MGVCLLFILFFQICGVVNILWREQEMKNLFFYLFLMRSEDVHPCSAQRQLIEEIQVNVTSQLCGNASAEHGNTQAKRWAITIKSYMYLYLLTQVQKLSLATMNLVQGFNYNVDNLCTIVGNFHLYEAGENFKMKHNQDEENLG